MRHGTSVLMIAAGVLLIYAACTATPDPCSPAELERITADCEREIMAAPSEKVDEIEARCDSLVENWRRCR